MSRARVVSAVGSLLTAALWFPAASCANGAAYTLHSENDIFAAHNRDRYYTSGVRLTGLHRAETAPELVRAVADSIPSAFDGPPTQVGWVVGQDINTPADTARDPPDPTDRPYAGWLYAGLLVARAVHSGDGPAGDEVEVLELDFGVVGPPSLAHQTQVTYHNLFGGERPEGWSHQLDTEPGIVAQYGRRRRVASGDDAGLVGGSWDLIGGWDVAGGNVLTQASVGGLVRWGSGLRRDFGPSTIHSTPVDVPDGGSEGGFRWYLFGGADGRYVAHNVTLDGNTWHHDSPSVDREPWVAEGRAGLALEWGSFRFSYTHAVRSREFDVQDDRHGYGSFALTWDLGF